MTAPMLRGLRVIDLSLWQPGQYATRLLADLGADVLKVEPPGGDRMRSGRARFADLNAGKCSVVLDLKTDADRAALLGLVRDADVVVENFRTEVAERLGVVFERLLAVNPSIVLCSVSGFGRSGPLAGGSGHDHNFQAHAGAMIQREDGPPLPVGQDFAGRAAGLAAAFAVLAAVLRARESGEGDHVDVSITDLLATWVAAARPLPDAESAGDEPYPASGVFRTADAGWVVLGIVTEDHFWDVLCRSLDLHHMVGATLIERTESSARLHVEIAAAVAARTGANLVAELAASGVPIAPVLTRDEVLNHSHFRERGSLIPTDGGDVRLGHPVRYAVHPALPPGEVPGLTPTPIRTARVS